MKRIILWLIALIPLLVTVVLLPQMADMVPAHYGIDGMVDRYDSKYTMLLFPLIIIVVVSVRDLAPRMLGRDDAQQANLAVLDRVLLPVVIMLVAFNLLTVWLATSQVQNIYATSVPVPQLILAGISLLFVVIGNVLPKTKPNWYVGIRVPWTVNHPAVWYKTHRFGGMVMTVWGVISLAVTLVVPPTYAAMVFTTGTLLMVASMLIYAYICYRQLPHEGHN
ncbi:MAG: SdpI family protein, partial [Roseiflexaceae bacterium]